MTTHFSALRGKNVILGVTGSIACYKAVDIASKLVQAGAVVDTVMTRSAQQFVSSLTFRSLTHRSVVTDLFDAESDDAVEHVALALRADVVLIAPATANVIAKIANGFADDALTAVVLATNAPVLLAPAMEGRMWANAAMRQNVSTLESRGFSFIGPAEGRLASGEMGRGRLEETSTVLNALYEAIGGGSAGDLAGMHVVVSAGGTQEPIDPVRIITNRSSGKQGYAIAEAARDRGARVTLVTAPTALTDPDLIEVVKVGSARDMLASVESALRAGADALVMAAAVADWEPASAAGQKMKKTWETRMTLELTKTPDILATVRELPGVKVGFAAETEDLLGNAKEKLSRKGLDLIVANDVSATDAGFNVDNNRVVILDRDGAQEELPLMSKRDVADRILDRVRGIVDARR
ncbi:MAG: bifunctional phosphopantothenoylcysteine decarboxylase/phosphopantothenate--cysteine ligase CoaBC [Dehalococcoidia bacterium]|nr:bifunctional phosphopantothenoylcysteine decarboxylase/phosphopantothenate--cysteine ligase CoaBC [Dehalococcoidia bacterium]